MFQNNVSLENICLTATENTNPLELQHFRDTIWATCLNNVSTTVNGLSLDCLSSKKVTARMQSAQCQDGTVAFANFDIELKIKQAWIKQHLRGKEPCDTVEDVLAAVRPAARCVAMDLLVEIFQKRCIIKTNVELWYTADVNFDVERVQDDKLPLLTATISITQLFSLHQKKIQDPDKALQQLLQLVAWTYNTRLVVNGDTWNIVLPSTKMSDKIWTAMQRLGNMYSKSLEPTLDENLAEAEGVQRWQQQSQVILPCRFD